MQRYKAPATHSPLLHSLLLHPKWRERVCKGMYQTSCFAPQVAAPRAAGANAGCATAASAGSILHPVQSYPPDSHSGSHPTLCSQHWSRTAELSATSHKRPIFTPHNCSKKKYKKKKNHESWQPVLNLHAYLISWIFRIHSLRKYCKIIQFNFSKVWIEFSQSINPVFSFIPSLQVSIIQFSFETVAFYFGLLGSY